MCMCVVRTSYRIWVQNSIFAYYALRKHRYVGTGNHVRTSFKFELLSSWKKLYSYTISKISNTCTTMDTLSLPVPEVLQEREERSHHES